MNDTTDLLLERLTDDEVVGLLGETKRQLMDATHHFFDAHKEARRRGLPTTEEQPWLINLN